MVKLSITLYFEHSSTIYGKWIKLLWFYLTLGSEHTDLSGPGPGPELLSLALRMRVKKADNLYFQLLAKN